MPCTCPVLDDQPLHREGQLPCPWMRLTLVHPIWMENILNHLGTTFKASNLLCESFFIEMFKNLNPQLKMDQTDLDLMLCLPHQMNVAQWVGGGWGAGRETGPLLTPSTQPPAHPICSFPLIILTSSLVLHYFQTSYQCFLTLCFFKYRGSHVSWNLHTK